MAIDPVRPSGVYYVIEHPNRGAIRVIEMVDEKPVPRYSWVLRLNSPKLLRVNNLPDAIKLVEVLRNAGVKGSKRLTIRKAPNFEYRCWDCGGWINDIGIGHRRNCPSK